MKKEISPDNQFVSNSRRWFSCFFAGRKSCFLIFLFSVIFFGSCEKNDQEPKSEMDKTKPELVWSDESLIDCSQNPPAIYYSPHQDDETIGMGASIAENVRIGKPVCVVLLTNGASMAMLKHLRKTLRNVSMADLCLYRNNEFLAACQTLGVNRVYISNSGSGFEEAVPQDVLVGEFKQTMRYMDKIYPNASHRTVSGNSDSYNSNCSKHPSHQAAEYAIRDLVAEGVLKDVRLYRVYRYYWSYGNCDKMPDCIKKVNPLDKQRRQEAIDQYRYVNKEEDRYGLGYWHSVKALFDNSWDSDSEFVDYCRN